MYILQIILIPFIKISSTSGLVQGRDILFSPVAKPLAETRRFCTSRPAVARSIPLPLAAPIRQLTTLTMPSAVTLPRLLHPTQSPPVTQDEDIEVFIPRTPSPTHDQHLSLSQDSLPSLIQDSLPSLIQVSPMSQGYNNAKSPSSLNPPPTPATQQLALTQSLPQTVSNRMSSEQLSVVTQRIDDLISVTNSLVTAVNTLVQASSNQPSSSHQPSSSSSHHPSASSSLPSKVERLDQYSTLKARLSSCTSAEEMCQLGPFQIQEDPMRKLKCTLCTSKAGWQIYPTYAVSAGTRRKLSDKWSSFKQNVKDHVMTNSHDKERVKRWQATEEGIQHQRQCFCLHNHCQNSLEGDW